MDINLDDELIEYLIFMSGTLERIGSSNYLMLDYSKIVSIVEQDEDAPIETQKTDDLLGNDDSNGYGDDFEEEKAEDPLKTESQESAKEESKKEPTPQQPGGEENLDEEIDDEQMISIAENCLIRIAEELLNKNITIRQLFKGEILEEEIEGEKIELLFPTSFLDGIQKLGITNFSDLENA